MNIRMLGDKVLVRLHDRPHVWHGLLIEHAGRYDDRWDYEDASVVAFGPNVSDLSVGDHVVVRARSGGKAGTNASQLGERLVIVDAAEVLALVDDGD